MKIIVLNGSPKGDISVTMQYIKYIQKKFKQHELKIINISQRINQIERDKTAFHSIISDVKSSDGIIWAFPLYVFTVHSNYQRFIELIFEKNVEYAFKEKYTSILATSIHFFDHTAVNYMNSICDDLNMNYIDYFSLHMYDLEKEDIRKNLLKFAQNFFNAIENKVITLKNYSPIKYSPIRYIPEFTHDKIDVSNKKVIIVADSLENINLKNMIDKLRNSFSQTIELVNLENINMKGSCLGCLKCGYNYECIYTGKDDFINFYNSKLKTVDIIVFAGTIKYRHLSSTWKRFFDRGFFNTHTPSLLGKQIGFIISGALNQIPNLKQILESYTQWQGSNLVGFITDECDTSIEIDKQLHAFSYNLIKLSTVNYSKPATFLGVAGMKIFRDEIWGKIRFPFIADHKAYKALNVYDFPQKNYKSRIMNFILILMSKFPLIRKEIYSNKMKSSMIEPLKKIVEDKTV
ncbi:NAD(P)H-dependent oxidoreductase [Clostridium sp. D2Q-14]|uniref:NAD(P)H-dependent oxidoreductase n=1 Tax=Anaeromonas gelatinilytica TaxID=2683194 RepID=UPI00193C6223|nr:NAD(P)H-dependent oxidoreductase [Anaeromonas gelatinilytica]MBS4535675.1 NAD(P)H-dependent oxidoreductase [Anaeromonas gelatinilytica]